jgi:hypothetical protein
LEAEHHREGRVFRLVIGIIGMVITYSYRPPSGLGDALGMMIQGRNFYLKEPAYLGLMAMFSLLAIFGLLAVIKGKRKEP